MNRQAKIKIIILSSSTFLLTSGIIFFFWNRLAGKNNFQSISNIQMSNVKQIQNSKQNSEINEQTYTNEKYRFSFKYPKGLNIAEFKEAGGDIVLAQSGENNQNAGFQIFILPFDEAGPITPARIQEDLPELKIEEPQNVIIGKDNVKALIFFGQEPGFNRTREVWFIYNGFLYQVFALAEMDAFFGKVMESWSFQ